MNEQLKAYIEHTRWFGGKGRDFEVTGTRRLPLSGPDDRTVTVELVTLSYTDAPGGAATDVETYQVPVSYYLHPQPELHHALIGGWEDPEFGHVYAYDALHDHDATPLWLRAFAEDATIGDLRFHRVGEGPTDLEARSTLLTGEQSNSSVAFGDQSLMKLFRRLTTGHNPDIEILEALTNAGNEHVARLFGWVETTTEDGEILQLGLIQQFLKTASDGWGLALASLRNLYANGVTHAEEAGGDFAAEAHRLGVAVAEMHASLAGAFPTETWGRADLITLADTMSARLDAAIEVLPELAALAPGLHAKFDAIRHLKHEVVVQRVHGDFHLGQTLRTVKNWKIIDFEGEPVKSLEERSRPDSPWRDVAGMLRSFDYAAELTRVDHEQATGDADFHDEERAREWAERNAQAFLEGYQESAHREINHPLLTAYTVDKAVYEAVYEARNRPGWLGIPLAALDRFAHTL